VPAVYSTSFAQLHDYAGSYIVTCPSGSVLVLRDVEAFFANELVISHAAVVGNEGQTAWQYSYTPGDSQWAQWQGRIVLEPGQSFTLVGGGAGVDLTASGYLLAL
jgi:hypothetical protein